MERIGSRNAMRARVRQARAAGMEVGLVPTMGALHEGHGELIRRARRETGFVVVSIFVNPIQFNQSEDFEKYPRDLDGDAALCAALGADAIFAPEAAEMYPAQPLTRVEVARVSEGLCGAWRPGHFAGVATVVAKLFNICEPDRAYFGEKDAQQLAVIRKMAADLDFAVRIEAVETVREPDGLAMSSRNRRLNAAQRAEAPLLYRALSAGRNRMESGAGSAADCVRAAREELEKSAAFRIEYLEVVDAGTMQPVEVIRGPVRIAAAAWMGPVRLIDNLYWEPENGDGS